MRHRNTTKSLGRKVGPRKALMKSLAQNLILHEKIKTTEAKAKVLRPYVERMVTTAKKGDLTARRALMKDLTTEGDPMQLVNTSGTLIGKIPGDGAEMVQIEFV